MSRATHSPSPSREHLSAALRARIKAAEEARLPASVREAIAEKRAEARYVEDVVEEDESLLTSVVGFFSNLFGGGESRKLQTRPEEISPTPTPSITGSPTPTPSITGSPTPTPSITESPTPTPSITGTTTPTPSVTGTPTGTGSPTPTPTPSRGVIGTIADCINYLIGANATSADATEVTFNGTTYLNYGIRTTNLTDGTTFIDFAPRTVGGLPYLNCTEFNTTTGRFSSSPMPQARIASGGAGVDPAAIGGGLAAVLTTGLLVAGCLACRRRRARVTEAQAQVGGAVGARRAHATPAPQAVPSAVVVPIGGANPMHDSRHHRR